MNQELIFQTSTVAVTSKEVLAIDDPVQSLKKRSNYIVFRYFYRFFLTHKICYERNAKISKATGLAIPTIVLAKRFLIDHFLIEVKVCDTWQKGKISYVYPTNQGWAKHHQIEAYFETMKEKPEEEPKKRKSLKYTETDVKTAKLWLATIRKWWRGYPQKQASLPNWDEEKEERADGIRRARESVNLNDTEFFNIIKEVTAFPENQLKFYVENIVGARKWTGRKWSNGKTPVQSLIDSYYSYKKHGEKKKITLCRETEPSFTAHYTIDPDVEKYGDEKLQEEIKSRNSRSAWNALWDCLGNRVRTYFRNEEERERYKKMLCGISQTVGDFSYSLGYNLKAIQFKNREVTEEWDADVGDKDAKAFFYFMRDKHYSDGNWLFDERNFQDDFIDFLTRVNSCCPCAAGQDQFEDDIQDLKQNGIVYYE